MAGLDFSSRATTAGGQGKGQGLDFSSRAAPAKPSSAWDQVGAFAQAATEQIPFLDEAAAWTASKIYGGSYEDMRKKQAALAAEDRQQRPLARNAGGVAGFGATLAAPGAGYIGEANTLGQAALRGAQVGAGYGALQGAATAPDGVQNRLFGAAQGAAIGAATGGALPVAGQVAMTGARALNNATGQRLMGPAAAAASRLRQALRADGVDAQTINGAVAEYQRTGAMPPSLADVAGENTRALLRYAGSRPGAARNMAQGYRDATVEGVPDASINRARELTPGDTRTAAQTADDLTQARQTAAQTDYAGPYAETINITPEVAGALRDGEGRAAVDRAIAGARANMDYGAVSDLERLRSASGMSELPGRAPVSPYNTLATAKPALPPTTGRALDRIQIAFGRTGRQLQEREGAADLAAGQFKRQGVINDALDSFEHLGEARANYASHSQAIEGVQDIGPTILRSAPDDFAASIAGLDERGLNATRVGARQAIADALGQRANASPVLRQIAFAPNTQRNLTALFGEDEANRFIQAARLNLEKANNANFIAPNTGSQTALRESDANAFGNVLRMIRDPVRAVLEKFANGLTMTDREAQELVRMGISSPGDAARVLRGGRGPAVNALAAHAATAIPSATAANVNLLMRPQQSN